MKLAIFGATGKTGLELVREAIGRGHSVTAFVRDPSRLPARPGSLTVITGDFDDPASVERCVEGQDAVLCALGSRDLKKTMIRSRGTIAMIEAMKAKGVRRLVVMSAMGVGESWKSLSLLNRLMFAVLMPATRKDHEAQEKTVRASGLEWTIVRPSGLTDGPRTGNYMTGGNIRPKTSRIPRGDVADLMLEVLESGTRIHESVTITN